MGIESVQTYLKSEHMEKLLTPPGFESQTTFVLRKIHHHNEPSTSVLPQDNSKRPWIVYDDHKTTTPTLKPVKSEIRRRLHDTKLLKEAPVFNPTEEEFKDTLSYISSLRERSEPYGICCVVSPPSWKPTCLLKEKKIWEKSTFLPQVQLFSRTHTEKPKIKKEFETDIDDDDKVKSCSIVSAPRMTLQSFKITADSSKKNLFTVKDEEPTVEEVEKEYRQIIENPLVEIGVLYGNDIDSKTFGSGFPLTEPSGWNLNNTANLPGSLLSFVENCESVSVPRLSVGACLSSQFWKTEKERLYALSYLHFGAPRVWYTVPASHRSKFKAVMRSLVSEMSDEHLKTMVLSPYGLRMEDIPVTRCVQKPGEYVIIFPGCYYSAFDCGFNCLEKVNFAPFDWLPHGDVAVLLHQEKCKKSLISYDELLFTAAREAVKCLREYSLGKRSEKNVKWKDSCGKDGIFSNIIKERINQEKLRHGFFSDSLVSEKMEKDDVRKKECCVCYADLYLSAVKCSCSDEHVYSCLRHMRKLCACPYTKKSFLYRYSMEELSYLVEALEANKLSSMFRWGDIDTTGKGKRIDNEVTTTTSTTPCSSNDVTVGSKTKKRSLMEILNGKEGGSGDSSSCTDAINTAKKQK